MSWKIRHQGSPRTVEGLTAQQVLNGMAEGGWEPTDEVMGPNDSAWVPLELHPLFAEAAENIEPPPPRHYDDETHLDMNALIDVCLVLLIFFILTASYTALQSRLDSPDLDPNKLKEAKITEKEVEQTTVKVGVTLEDGKPVYRVEDRVTEEKNLASEISRYAGKKGVTILFLEVDPRVPHGVTVGIQDKAAGIGIKKVIRPFS